MADYTLYCMGESGNAYKVALMLNLCGCDWQPKLVNMFAGETRSEVWRDEINEQGELPVLEYAGQRRSQSGAILTWLAQKTGQFGGQTEEERWEILRWLLFDNHKFTSFYATLRFLLNFAKTGETPVTDFLRTRALGAYAIVDKHLSRQDFIVGSAPTIADLSLAGYIYHPEPTGIDHAQFPHLQAWAGRIAALPGWASPYDLMPRAAPV